MRDQAMLVKQKLEKIVVTVKRGAIEIEISGDQKVHRFLVDGVERHDLKDAVNEAVKKSQETAAKQMQGMMGSLKFPGV